MALPSVTLSHAGLCLFYAAKEMSCVPMLVGRSIMQSGCIGVEESVEGVKLS